MQPVARLADELRENAIANLALGDVALLAAAVQVDHPGRSVLLFAIVNVVLAFLWGRLGAAAKVRAEAPRAADLPPEAERLDRAATRRRILVGLAPVAIVLAVLIGVAPESAAVIAGVPAGVGAGDLWLLGWVRAYERDRRDELYREAARSPFTAGARAVYTRPMNAETDDT